MSKEDAPELKESKQAFMEIVGPQNYEGIHRVPSNMEPENIKASVFYQPKPGDLFLVGYMKSGTTWLAHIVASVFKGGVQPFSSFMDYQVQSPRINVVGTDVLEVAKRPFAITVYTPFRFTPWSPKAKYIVLYRNPKDVCTSMYHFMLNKEGRGYDDNDFDHFFELFINNRLGNGDYFEHQKSWYEHRNDPNVLFITYERLKEDTKAVVLELAEFMGHQYKEPLTTDDSKLQGVLHHCSVEVMRKVLGLHLAELADTPLEEIEANEDIPPALKRHMLKGTKLFKNPTNHYVRKGVIGDWKNIMSPSQSRRLEEKLRETMNGTDISELWKD